MMYRYWIALAAVLSMTPASSAAKVWEATFDSDADGVVDVRTDNPRKDMIGSNAAGRQTIVTMAQNDTVSDKAGRALGTPVGAGNSCGALYRFQWAALPPTGSQETDEFAGFISGSSPHCSRQLLGCRIQHLRNSPGHDMVRLVASFGSVGNTYVGYKYGSFVDLGSAEGMELQLAIGYDAATKILKVALFDVGANKLAEVQSPIDQLPTLGFAPGSPEVQNELSNLAVTHLGWTDFLSAPSVDGRTTTWEVNSLAYYNDAALPFADAGAGIPGACCHLDGSCSLTSGAACDYQWHGAGSECGSVTCTAPLGACCDPSGICSETTAAACTGLWSGPDTTCATATCAPGACCESDGTCSQTSVFACDGEWSPNLTCEDITCTAATLGACCHLDGTCSVVAQGDCDGAWQGSGSACEAQTCAGLPVPTWLSTFDSSTDQVEDVRNDNPNKVMIGLNTGGRLLITTMSRNTTEADKAGRPIPGPVLASGSVSGLYDWKYTDYGLAAENVGVEEFAGFISDYSTHCTRQFLGARLYHYRQGEDYRLQVGAAWGSVGYTYTGHKTVNVSLGPTPPVGRNFLLAIGYDGPSKNLWVALYSRSTRELIAMVGGDIRAFPNLGVPPNHPALLNELDNLSLTHLGWTDFIGDGSADGLVHVWSVDNLALYGAPSEAFRALGVNSPFLGACCRPDLTCLDALTSEQCSENWQGTWQGLNSTCAQSTCLPSCNNPRFDADEDGDVDTVDFGAFQACVTGSDNVNGPLDAVHCHCFDAEGDGDVDASDFDAFAICGSGAGVLADTGCDGPP